MKRNFLVILIIIISLTTILILPSITLAKNKSLSKTHTIKISGYAFTPKALQIAKGDTVIWINEDEESHSVTTFTHPNKSYNGVFDSGLLAKGKQFKFTVQKTGAYSFFCKVHTSMEGKLTVK